MAITLAQILTDLYDITKRPDLIAESKLAVKMATQKLHHSDFFPRDLIEVGFTWNTPAFVQSLEYGAVFTRFRSLKFLRKVASGIPTTVFTLITPEQVLDSYRRDRVDVCYLAGSMIEIKSSTQDTDMILGYYQHPDTTDATYSSWIANDYEDMVLVEAAATVFKMIGFDEQAATFNKLSADNMMLLKTNALGLGGF